MDKANLCGRGNDKSRGRMGFGYGNDNSTVNRTLFILSWYIYEIEGGGGGG